MGNGQPVLKECASSAGCASHELCLENNDSGVNVEVPISGRIDPLQIVGLTGSEAFNDEIHAQNLGSVGSSLPPLPPLFPKGRGPGESGESVGNGHIGMLQKMQSDLEHTQQMLQVANSSWRRAEARAREEKALGAAMLEAEQKHAAETLKKIVDKDIELREAEKSLSSHAIQELHSKACELEEANARVRVLEATFKHLKEAGLDPGLVGSMMEDAETRLEKKPDRESSLKKETSLGWPGSSPVRENTEGWPGSSPAPAAPLTTQHDPFLAAGFSSGFQQGQVFDEPSAIDPRSLMSVGDLRRRLQSTEADSEERSAMTSEQAAAIERDCA